MTEVTRSPEVFLGKRRGSMDCDVEVENPSQTSKRYRVVSKSSSGLDGLRHGDENSLHAFKRNKSGSFTGETNLCPAAPSNHNEQIEQYYQSMIASLKMEHQMALSRRDQDIQRLQQENHMLHSRCQAMTAEHNGTVEECRVLKRAVAIQDSRCRELSATHDQLQHVMALAAEHIAKLEEANRDLTAMVNGTSHFGNGMGGFPPGPPDVY
jgi:chromosome segregation ATPase